MRIITKKGSETILDVDVAIEIDLTRDEFFYLLLKNRVASEEFKLNDKSYCVSVKRPDNLRSESFFDELVNKKVERILRNSFDELEIDSCPKNTAKVPEGINCFTCDNFKACKSFVINIDNWFMLDYLPANNEED